MSEVLRYSAFAAAPGGGNPAGVVLDADGLSEERMQQIAAEVGFSETAFVSSGSDGRYRVRFWSPAAEVPFCGHASVASAVALAERHGPGSIVLETPVGPVAMDAVADAEGSITVSFTSVEPEVRALDEGVCDRLLELLGLSAADLDPRFAVREAFAGNWHPIVFLADRVVFDRFRFSPPAVAELMRERGWRGTVTVLHLGEDAATEAPEGVSAVIDARNLFPVGQITEDPATGSAAAAVGAYLRTLGAAPVRVLIRQGAHIGRPSELLVTIPAAGGIVVTGGAQRIE